MSLATPAAWAQHLRSIAGPLPPPGTRLGAGEVDAPLLAAATGRAIEVPARWRSTEPRSAPASAPTLDVHLWWLVHQPQASLSALLDPDGSGPLLAPGEGATIEVWTECELCALHALGRIVHGARPGDGGVERTSPWRARLDAARRWHLEHTQPDNATGRPWAIAVFAAEPAPESQLYAQTLLHNALVAGPATPQAQAGPHPRLEPLAAVILADAALTLEAIHEAEG